MSDVSKVWSTSPSAVFFANTPYLRPTSWTVGRIAGKKSPAVQIGAEVLRVFLQHLGRIALRVDGDRNEGDLRSERGPSFSCTRAMLAVSIGQMSVQDVKMK